MLPATNPASPAQIGAPTTVSLHVAPDAAPTVTTIAVVPPGHDRGVRNTLSLREIGMIDIGLPRDQRFSGVG